MNPGRAGGSATLTLWVRWVNGHHRGTRTTRLCTGSVVESMFFMATGLPLACLTIQIYNMPTVSTSLIFFRTQDETHQQAQSS